MTSQNETFTDLSAALREALDTLDAIRSAWQASGHVLRSGDLEARGQKALAKFDKLMDGTLKVAQGVNDSWDLQGYNHCLTQGAGAIRHLLKHGPASGGEQSYNEEHCIQIANELLAQVDINKEAFSSGGRLGRTLRVVPADHAVEATPTGTTVPLVKFERLARHAKAQDSEIAKLRAEVNDLRFYKTEDAAVWVWQGDGEDHLESLGCPVLIQPKDLLDLIRATPLEFAQIASIDRQGLFPQGKLGRQALTSPYYLAECDSCGWLGSSEELRVSTNYPDSDADAACPSCGNLECDEIDTARALEVIHSLVDGATNTPEAAAG